MWSSAHLDLPADMFERGAAFWHAVDPDLDVRRVDDGAGGVRMELHDGAGPTPRSGLRVGSVVVDVPPEEFDDECTLWVSRTGAELRSFDAHPEYRRVVGLEGGVGVLLQRLGSGPRGLHLDVAATDRAAEVRRHVTLGAVPGEAFDDWTVMRDPLGRVYCVVDDH